MKLLSEIYSSPQNMLCAEACHHTVYIAFTKIASKKTHLITHGSCQLKNALTSSTVNLGYDLKMSILDKGKVVGFGIYF